MNEPRPQESQEPRARLFFALDIPEGVRAGVAAWAGKALDRPQLRLVAAESLHVTLAFLGHRPEGEIPALAATLAGLSPRPIPMRLRAEPEPRPRRRPRVVALQLDSPAAVELQAELVAALEDAELYKPERRRFWPHLTVARMRSQERMRGRLEPLPEELIEPFGAVRGCLYRSTLRPGGSKYASLASLDLPPAATEPGAEER